MAVVTLAMSPKFDEAILLLIAVTNSVDRKLDGNFPRFVGILSVKYSVKYSICRLVGVERF